MDKDSKNNWVGLRNAQILLALLFFIFLAHSVSAQTVSDSNGVYNLRAFPWELAVLAALFVNLGFVSLSFMISRVFGIKELSGWANNELYQIVMMSLVVFLFFSAIKIENMVFNAYGFTETPEHPNGAIENAKDYLRSVQTYVLSIVTSGHTFKIALSMTNKYLEAALELPFFDIDKTINSIFDSTINMLNLIITSSGTVLGLTTMQIYFLDFIENLAFKLILPVGLLLRMFSISRNMGNFLIVVAISFYIVFPLTFTLNQEIVNTLLDNGDWSNIIDARTKNNDFGMFLTNMETSFKDDTNSIFTPLKASANAVSSLPSLVWQYLNPLVLFEEAAFAFLLFTLIPIIDFTITVVVAKELGYLFGSDVDFSKVIKEL